MEQNPFDQFDAPASTSAANPFDQFDEAKKSSVARRALGDTGISLLKGAIAVPEAAIGIADIATGGRAGKVAEGLGFRPKEAKEILNEYYSPEQKAANQKLSEAEGFVDNVKTAVQNPSTILQAGVESVPLIAGGGVVGLGARALKAAPVIAGAIGEGAVGAGMAAEGIRQETDDGLLSAKQSGIAALSGIGTAAFGVAGGKLANKLGIGDIDTIAAGGASPTTNKGFARKLVEGGIAEGVFEELPQSVQEQMLSNYALDKPLTEGVDKAAAMGLLTGSAMGAGVGALTGGKDKLVIDQSGLEADDALAEQKQAEYDAQQPAQAEPDEFTNFTQQVDADIEQRKIAAGIKKPAEAIPASDILGDENVSDTTNAATSAVAETAQPAGDNTQGSVADLPIQPNVSGVGDVAAAPASSEPGNVATGTGSNGNDTLNRPFAQATDDFLPKMRNMTTDDKVKAQIDEELKLRGIAVNPEASNDVDANKAGLVNDKTAVAGEKINKEWTAFSPESGTLNIPRAEMPQVKAEHRGAMVNFLNARGVDHTQETVPASSLKPTQQEFSEAKVKKASKYAGGDRSILVSSDNHVLDGHHQWLSKLNKGGDVDVIRLNAPITQLLDDVKEFPSSTVEDGATSIEPSDKSGQVKVSDDVDYSTMSYEQLQQAREEGRANNKALDVAVIRKHAGDELANEAQSWSQRAIDKWFDQNATAEMEDESSTFKGVDIDKIDAYSQAFNNFDETSPQTLGASIALKMRDIDKPDFVGSPEFVTIRNALAYSKEQGWKESDVLDAMRARAESYAGRDAPELFERLFKTKPITSENGKSAQALPTNGAVLPTNSSEVAPSIEKVSNSTVSDVIASLTKQRKTAKAFNLEDRLNTGLDLANQMQNGKAVSADKLKTLADLFKGKSQTISFLMDDLYQEAAKAKPAKATKPKAPKQYKPKTLLATLRDLGGIALTEKQDVTGEVKGFAPGGYNQVFKSNTTRSLKGLIESGDLDDYLPYGMRLESSGMNDDAFDSTEAYDYLADKIRNGESVLPYDAEQEIAASKYYDNQDIQNDIDVLAEELDLVTINALLQEAGHDERESTTEAAIYESEGSASKAENTEQASADGGIGSGERETATAATNASKQTEVAPKGDQDLLGDNTAAKQAIADAERAKDSKRNSGNDNQDTFTLTGSNSEADQAAAAGAQDLFSAPIKQQSNTEASVGADSAENTANQSNNGQANDEASEIDYNGVRLYKIKVRNRVEGQPPTEMWAVESTENKARKARGERAIGGDNLSETLDEAKAEAELMLKREADNNQAADAQAKREAEQKEQSRIDADKKSDIDGFGSELNAMQLGKLKETLNKPTSINGVVSPLRDAVRNLVSKGGKPEIKEENVYKGMSRAQYNRADNRAQQEDEKRIREGGKKNVYYITMPDGGMFELGKTAHDFAEHLIAKAETKPQDEVAKATEALTAAGVKGKEKLDTIKDVREGKVTADEVAEAYGELAAQKHKGKVDDFGEKLEGARKDMVRAMAKEYSDDELASLPLSKIWPITDVNLIENKTAAAIAWAAREEIPSKPRKPYAVRTWVGKVKVLRDIGRLVNKALEVNPELMLQQIKDANLGHFKSKVALLEAIDREQWKRIGKVEEYPNAYRYEGSSKIQSPLVNVEIDGNSTRFDASSVADIIDKVNEKLGVAPQDKRMAFEVRGARGTYFINKKGDKNYTKLKSFDSSKEAFAFIRDNYDEVVAAWDATKDRLNVKESDVRNKENRPRTGEDYRKGKNVSSEEFATTFGFRGIQFGEWVKQGGKDNDRQGALNAAYDALMDLANIINVPPKALSLEGTLGLSFGARGKGSAAAHFEPGNLVINLTKTQGAGTLAHEWFHALDNYFSRKRGGEKSMAEVKSQQSYREGNYITYKPEALYINKNYGNKGITKAELERYRKQSPNSKYWSEENWILDPKHPQGVRPEVEVRFADLVDALNTSPMKQRARSIDGVKEGTDGYWSRIIELGARAFENYVIHKMQLNGYDNDYLANVVRVDSFNRDSSRFPYLLDEEVEPVAEAFDNLFSEIKTKETDSGNVALFSRSNTNATPYRGMDKDKAQSIIDELQKSHKGIPKVKLVDHHSKLPIPSSIIEEINGSEQLLIERLELVTQLPSEQNIQAALSVRINDVEGVYSNGEIWINTNAINSEDRLREVFAHEAIGHMSVENMLNEVDKTLFPKLLTQVKTLNKAGNKYIRGIWDDVKQSQPDIDDTATAGEVLAFIAERGEQDVEMSPVARSIWQRLIDGIKAFAKLVFNVEMTDVDVRDIVSMASRYAKGEDVVSLISNKNMYYSRNNREPSKENGDTFLTAALEFTARNEEFFDNAPSDSKNIADIAKDIDVGYRVEPFGQSQTKLDGAEKAWEVFMPDAKYRSAVIYEKGDEVWINVSRLKSGENQGNRIYSLAAAYAYNNDKVFIGDPLGLTAKAFYRRAESMLSSALKYGTTKHIEPHVAQTDPDLYYSFDEKTKDFGEAVRKVNWKKGDDAHNIKELIYTVYHGAITNLPELKNVIFDPTTQGFTTINGEQFTDDDFERVLSDYYARTASDSGSRVIDGSSQDATVNTTETSNPYRAGIRTAKRAAFFNTFLRKQSSEVRAELLGSYVRELQNRGLAPALRGVMYSRSNPQSSLTPQWDSPAESKLDNVVYALQDKNVDLKRVSQAIKKAGTDIADRWNAYLQEELYHGRTAKRTQDFIKNDLEPLIEDMRMRGVGMADFEEYLWARHAEERNIQIAKINPKMPDGGSGMSTQDARDYLAKLSPTNKTKYEALARRIDLINRKSRQVLVDYGLESTATIASWESAYKNYVPLMREDMDAGFGNGTGQGFSVKGNSAKRATGSNRAVVDIIANMAQQYEKNVIRGEKNRVSTALIGLAKLNPNPDFWEVDTPPSTKTIVKGKTIYEVLYNGSKVNEFTNKPAASNFIQWNGSTGYTINEVKSPEQVEYVTDPNYKNRDNVIVARIVNKLGKVEERSVVFNQFDERAMRMAASLKNLDQDQIGELLGAASGITRYFASVNTQYNPIFGLINITRDVQGALLNLSTTPIANKKKEVLGNTLDALKGIYQDLRSERKNGTTTGNKWSQLFEEFQNEGGQTGYRDMFRNAKERGEALKNALDPTWWQNSKIGKVISLNGAIANQEQWIFDKAIKPIFDWLSDYNNALENAVRLSVYKVALDNGHSKQQAASMAKNISVNFNRKGEMGRQIGSLYAFFNASVQGTARIGETLTSTDTNGKIKLSTIGKRIVQGGLLLGAMQALLLAAAGYDDDEPPEFVRDRSIIIPLDFFGADGKFITAPMPLGYNAIPAFSRILTEWALSGGENTQERLVHILDMVMNVTNPIGNAGLSLQTIAPTVIDPLAALAENKDFTGRPIAREDFNSLNPTPGFTRAKDTASAISKGLAYGINAITGGTDYKPGEFSPSPDQIDYLIGQVTGGVGREAMKVEQTATALVTGEDLPAYKIPIVGRFYGDATGQSSQGNAFYKNLREINKHENQIKGMIKAGEDPTQYRLDNPESRLITQANYTERAVQKLRKQRRGMLEKGSDPSAIESIDERITELMLNLNEKVKLRKEMQ